MTDRKLTLVFVGVGFLALVFVAVFNSIHGRATADLLDKAMILAAALLPSPLSKTTITDEVTTSNPLPVDVKNSDKDPVPVDPDPAPDA